VLCSHVVQRLEENKRVLLLEGPSVSVSLSSSLIVGAQTAVRRLCVEYKVSRLSVHPCMRPVQSNPNTAHSYTPSMPLMPSKHAAHV
jgi:hypothetical protein